MGMVGLEIEERFFHSVTRRANIARKKMPGHSGGNGKTSLAGEREGRSINGN
jgi:hypothetical protein